MAQVRPFPSSFGCLMEAFPFFGPLLVAEVEEPLAVGEVEEV
jgi:hypothetical protein